MATTIVTSYFASAGSPALGEFPTVNIWEVLAGSETLVINGGAMSEIGDGMYKYVFTLFDQTKDYVIISDKITGSAKERYSIGSIGDMEINLDATDLTAIADAVAPAVWEEQASIHMTLDTMGLLQNTTAANNAAIQIDMATTISLVTTLLKYEENRTKIDKLAKTLTIYDDDGVTPLKVFDLKDGDGVPSIIEVCERFPV